MEPLFDRILTFNLIASTAIFYAAARIYLLPHLGRLALGQVIVPILLLHALRHLGLMFLTRGAVYSGMPPLFAYPAAVGDLIAAGLAVATLLVVVKNPPRARPLLWIFNIFGTLDLFLAVTLATTYGAPVFMGPAYWIPAFWVPLLLVTHYITFRVLLRPWPTR